VEYCILEIVPVVLAVLHLLRMCYKLAKQQIAAAAADTKMEEAASATDMAMVSADKTSTV
jgi:hypothetical protein